MPRAKHGDRVSTLACARHSICLVVMAAASACGGGGAGEASPQATPVQATTSVSASPQASTGGTLDGKTIVGYQGWFGCPGDFDGNNAWIHWFNGQPATSNLLVDMLPDTSALSSIDLCDTGLKKPDGDAVHVFSSQNPHVVDYHFALMAKAGVGAVALQRFVIELQTPQGKRRSDNVLGNVIASAAAHQVPFCITYDVSGADPATVSATIRADWASLQSQFHLARLPQYQTDFGRPVVELWGFGFTDRPGTPDEVSALISDLHSGSAGLPATTVIGGVPSAWATLSGDSKSDATWAQAYAAYDMLSPWLVGRYDSTAAASTQFADETAPDAGIARARGQRYLPVVFPGFSWHNLMHTRGISVPVDQIPRQCGSFLWSQARLVRNGGFSSVYGAMFDEFDEGTALLPAIVSAADAPAGASVSTLGAGGCTAPSNWYLTLLASISAAFAAGVPLGSLPTP